MKRKYKFTPEGLAKRQAGTKANRRPCTVDGKKIYPTVQALIGALGQGSLGYKHKDFRYV